MCVLRAAQQGGLFARLSILICSPRCLVFALKLCIATLRKDLAHSSITPLRPSVNQAFDVALSPRIHVHFDMQQ